MIKKTISAGQRKYFEGRINNACDDQISDIKYINAAKIVEITKREHTIYLKNLKVDSKLNKYTTISPTYHNAKDMVKAFSELHQETMKDKNMGTAMNKQIAHIKAKKQEALDFLFGLNDLNELREGLTNILGEADIKLLGDGNGQATK